MSIQHLFPIDNWVFKSNAVLQDLSQDDIALLQSRQIVQTYHKGEIIFKEGMSPFGIYCIKEGLIKKFKTDKHNKEQILYIAGAGELIGYHAVLAEEPYSDSAAALEDSILAFIPAADFLYTLDRSPEFGRRMLKTLSHQFSVLANNMSALAQRTVRERLALQLIILREKYKVDFQPGMEVTIDINREDLAALVGTGREHVIRLLTELKEENILETKGSKIIIKNVQALIQYASQ